MTKAGGFTKHKAGVGATWRAAIDAARGDPAARARAELVVGTAARYIESALAGEWKGKRVALAWSAGKDSQILRLVLDTIGVDRGMIGMTDLEFPAYEAWVAEHIGGYEMLRRSDINIEWVAAREDRLLFPPTAAAADVWMTECQRWCQRRWARDNDIDIMLLGRRRADGNFCGRQCDHYVDPIMGYLNWSPLAAVSNADAAAILGAYDIALPPMYWWPRAFDFTAGRWSSRRRLGSMIESWREVDSIDPSVVDDAAPQFVSGRNYMEVR